MKFARFVFALITATLLASCTSCPFGHRTTASQKVEHVVLIWLKNPGNAAERAKVIASVKQFQHEIAEIQHLSVGEPLPSDRPVVDDSFDVGLVLRFADKAALTRYEKHPAHVRAVESTLKPLAKKLLVYDIETR
jgi:hypothetical protein